MKNISTIVRKHKNTATSILSTLAFIYLSFELWQKAITWREYIDNLTLVAGAVATIVGFIAKDGKDPITSKKNEKSNSTDAAPGPTGDDSV